MTETSFSLLSQSTYASGQMNVEFGILCGLHVGSIGGFELLTATWRGLFSIE